VTKAALDHEMDELRQLLDGAFAELFERLAGVEATTAAALAPPIEPQSDVTAQQTEAALHINDALTSIGSLALQALDRLDEVMVQLETVKAATDDRGRVEASLRHDIERLAEAVHVQENGIGELRTTLDWIKERLLLR
jgi:hypothetical protein